MTESQFNSMPDVSVWPRRFWVLALFACFELAVFAFGHLFTTFPSWDDEGYFVLVYRDFLLGRILFNQVFSFYGPLSFFLVGVVARFDANNVTHDSLRWMVLV